MHNTDQNKDSIPSREEEKITTDSASYSTEQNPQKIDSSNLTQQYETLKTQFVEYQRKAEADKITLSSRIQMLQDELSETKRLYQSAEATADNLKAKIGHL